jgi:cyclic pyranopterin phosphate synthase
MSADRATSDQLGRPLRSLRISVTDRCNLRCSYCMPEQEYVWLPRADILDFDEIARAARVFGMLGVDKLRLTGGEPLLRRDLPELVATLAGIPTVRDLALTTNGVLLRRDASALWAAGLARLTVSLDTLHADRFAKLTGRPQLPQVLDGLEHAAAVGFGASKPGSLKLNAVVMRGVNDDELVALLDHGKHLGAEVRFIEYMDVGGATQWDRKVVVSCREMLDRIARERGPVRAAGGRGPAPADRFQLADGTVFGVIASTTQPFCRSCDRARLTADGVLYTCLYAREGTDVRALLRGVSDDAEIAARVAEVWRLRTDRGAEERLAVRERAPLARASELREDPHLEMHTRGG